MKYIFLISGIFTAATIVLAMMGWGWLIGGNREIEDQVGQIIFAFSLILLPLIYISLRANTSIITFTSAVILSFSYWVPIILIGFKTTPDANIGLGLVILVSPLFIVVAVLIVERAFVSSGWYHKWKHKLFPPHSPPNSNR